MKRLLALAATLALTLSGPAAALAQSNDNQVEVQIGQQEYQQLQQKGEIIPSSPYYAILNPIAQQIKRVADPQYFRPFNFILVHESQPNAFAVPGGNVYVTDALMRFAKNREELAGVLCHETSHTIHHDVLNLYKKQQRTATTFTIGDILANVLTGGRSSGVIDSVAQAGFAVQSMTFSRDVESAADKKGAETCAQAGSNPWGLVWLFEQFEKADTGGRMEMLSDHPTDQHRIDDLKRDFAADPSLYGRFSPSVASATPLTASASQHAAATAPARTAAVRSTTKSKGMFPPGSGYKY